MTFKDARKKLEGWRHADKPFFSKEHEMMQVIEAFDGKILDLQDTVAGLRNQLDDAVNVILTDCYDTEGVQ
jgi:hypothetical protein